MIYLQLPSTSFAGDTHAIILDQLELAIELQRGIAQFTLILLVSLHGVLSSISIAVEFFPQPRFTLFSCTLIYGRCLRSPP